jgi:oligoribonuclease NrnB/cAMP/cGMP phosphodiesterase (DHH superfamily)
MADAGRPLVLYHGPDCADGFTAAWAAHRCLGGGAEYVPVQYGQPPPDAAGDRDRELYVLDFSYPRDVMFRLAALRHERVVVLDHHKTARAALDGLEVELASNNCGDALTAVFDMGKSGARLAWEYFFPGEPAPFLVELVEDRDLWRWQAPHSREFNAWLASLPRNFEDWDQIARDLERPWREEGTVIGGRTVGDGWVCDGLAESAREQGRAILRYQAKLVDSACAHAREVDIDGHKVLAVNATCLFSEVAGKLAEGRPFGAAWFVRGDGKKVWSLRSRDGGVDVSEVARRHGGGGHRNAAGYEEDLRC